jgi:hypothetical protein
MPKQQTNQNDILEIKTLIVGLSNTVNNKIINLDNELQIIKNNQSGIKIHNNLEFIEKEKEKEQSIEKEIDLELSDNTQTLTTTKKKFTATKKKTTGHSVDV